MSLLAGLTRDESLLAFAEPVDDDRTEDIVQVLTDGLTEPQRQVWNADHRFKLLCSGRRFGKTYLCITRLICWAMEKPGSLCWYVTANYRMAKQIAWRQLKTMTPEGMIAKKTRLICQSN